ncbi:hypothetical protein BCR33DRAFT_256 [Rhizoclosmatium globosum]|uniref:Uncharacterized protein n=1 Tax=Rhizoclosmatium globosum TaxID=329046 RepID=A0A1Y2D2S6_9FUNG|nr:hypothetical protein BCR33DRAFT_256 [Rhizoclosmatium globosum]|eukprot:ORY53424.1 hypothetical protein BCR33DRAFT_256 [Rhizoclosmatium globosum]
MGLLTILVSFLIYGGIGAVGFRMIPPSEDQLIFRTALSLTFVCTWMMWAITYLAQLNPLVYPERAWTVHHATATSGSH